jgi:hypothetical protein
VGLWQSMKGGEGCRLQSGVASLAGGWQADGNMWGVDGR